MNSIKYVFNQIPLSEFPETLEILYRQYEEGRATDFNFLAKDHEHGTYIVHGHDTATKVCHIAIWRLHEGQWQPLARMMQATPTREMFVELCSNFAHEAILAGATDAEFVFEVMK